MVFFRDAIVVKTEIFTGNSKPEFTTIVENSVK
jgi:hypothetical protein